MNYSVSKTNKEPLHVQIQKHIRHHILTGQLKPGDRLSNEIELGDKFNVSRNTVRQALQALVAEGLLHRTPGRGTFVLSSPKIPHTYSNTTGPSVIFIQPTTWVGRILHPFYTRLIQGLQDMLSARQYTVYYHPITPNSEHINLSRYPTPIAVILADIHHNSILRQFRDNNLLAISVHERFYDDDVFCILPDNVFGGFAATSHLIELGETPIAHLTGNNTELMDRLKGYKSALAQNSIDYDDRYVIDAESNEDLAYTATQELLQLPEPPKSIFAASGSMALGSFKAIMDAKMRIPEDISIVGYDDLEIFQFLHPALTTIAQPAYEIGQKVAELIFNIESSNKADVRQERLIKPRLVQRASTLASMSHSHR